jgi:hypothetical protein
MRAVARERGGHCLSAEYRGGHVHHRWRCAEGHEWNAWPMNIFHGTWCKRCSARLDLEELQRTAQTRGGRCLATKHVSVESRVTWECAEGHRWDQSPARLRYGRPTWCPTCARASKLTLTELRDLAAKQGGACLSETATTKMDAYRWKCAVGHVFSMSAKAVTRGSFCPRCRSPQKRDLARFQRIAGQRKGECLSKTYVNSMTRLQFRCKAGHAWWAIPMSIARGSWCRVCSRNRPPEPRPTLENLHVTAAKFGGRCLATKLEHVTSSIPWECALGHRWTTRTARVRTWCPTCAFRILGTIDAMRAFASRMGGRCLSTEYNGPRTLLTFECAAGHRFTTTGAAVKSGVWCIECAPGA